MVAELVSSLLGDPKVKLCTTRCVLAELEKLGSAFKPALSVISQYKIVKCGHESPVVASECLGYLAGESNPMGFLFATQDRSLMAELREIPGSPILYINFNLIAIDPPSDKSLKMARKMDRRKLRVPTNEARRLGIGGGEKKKKRKKTKGPNPLSVKKKKKSKGKSGGSDVERPAKRSKGLDGAAVATAAAGNSAGDEAEPVAAASAAAVDSEAAGEATGEKPKRKRKRRHKKKKKSVELGL